MLRNRKKNEVKYEEIIGFVLSAVLLTGVFTPRMTAFAAGADSKAGIVTTQSGRLNVRSGASTSFSVVGSLNKGSCVTLIERSGSWWKVEYAKGQYGYCHGDYITQTEATPAAVTTESTNLNVRSGAGVAYSVIDSLPRGETVLVLETSGGWRKVLYSGTKVGYVSGHYLTEMESGYRPISLSVPDYKQGDSRWANVKIGSSGKTIGQIGCVTAGIAMLESYRGGTAIYPDAMAKKLSYDAKGNVYWPGDYNVVTSQSGYLSGIYEQLSLGKPVLIGAKTNSGSQHWVVVTGYMGGDILTASGFTINDPGSNTRTNLQQFLNAFPNFYKYFYY